MMSFKEWLPEAFLLPWVPAIRTTNNKVYHGRRGEIHDEIILRHPEILDDNDKHESGYWNTKQKAFIPKGKTYGVVKRDSPVDTTDLMTAMQRNRYQDRMDDVYTELVDMKKQRWGLR